MSAKRVRVAIAVACFAVATLLPSTAAMALPGQPGRGMTNDSSFFAAVESFGSSLLRFLTDLIGKEGVRADPNGLH